MFGAPEQDRSSKAEKIKPRHKFSDLVYPSYIKSEIMALLEEEPYAHALVEEGLQPKRKILLYGPSGCGKTSIAHALANELNLPLLAATGDALAMQRQAGHRFQNGVVNTLLTSLDRDEMEGFFIACTNHKDHLDQALLRRFDLVRRCPCLLVRCL